MSELFEHDDLFCEFTFLAIGRFYAQSHKQIAKAIDAIDSAFPIKYSKYVPILDLVKFVAMLERSSIKLSDNLVRAYILNYPLCIEFTMEVGVDTQSPHQTKQTLEAIAKRYQMLIDIDYVGR